MRELRNKKEMGNTDLTLTLTNLKSFLLTDRCEHGNLKLETWKQPPSPCWFLAFFCFLFAPDKRLIVVCFLPRSSVKSYYKL